MNTGIGVYKKQEGYIKNSLLILLAFATAFFPRILNSIGFPSPINFVHFVIVPIACGIVVTKTKVRNKNQISIAKAVLVSFLILLGTMTASAFLNKAGLINIFLSLMLLSEPFLVLLAIICIPISQEKFKKFRVWILRFGCFHIFLAIAQHFLITIGRLRVTEMQPTDNVQGVFYLTGSGHVVAASVSMCFGLYYLISAKTAPIWLRLSVIVAAFFQLLFADAKQVLLVWLLAWFILILIKLQDLRKTIQYLIAAILICYGLWWCIGNVEAFAAFNTWIRPGLYGPDGEATLLKLAPIRIIPTFYKSSLNWLLGLGPGHTVGRLGGWMLKDYSSLLKPLGATIHPASQAVWDAWSETAWLDSSFFAPLWGWAGIWGDFGFLGLGAYLYLASIVWYRICLDDFCKFTMLTVLIYGFIFTQLEEPGYMLSMAMLIGMRWHELQILKYSRLYNAQLGTEADRQLKAEI
ncbi:hypothetical protein NIES4106_03920 [Fischerella sp. NIES-4106]|nr:hypothetical protein NIES4106_03920 [Fischerella sp. NIES-4106]